MAGEFDFGDNGDEAAACILHYVADFVLGVETAVAGSVALVVISGGLVSPGSDFGQEGIFLYLYAPPLVLGEVPVEAVLLVHRHHVEELLYGLDRIEVAATVELHTAPGYPGSIFDETALRLPLHALHLRGGIGGSGKQLAETLEAVEGPRRGRGEDSHPPVAHLEPVALLRYAFILLEDDGAAEGISPCGDVVPGGNRELLPEIGRHLVEPGAVRDYSRVRAEDERAVALHYGSGLRNDGDGEEYGKQKLHPTVPFL